MFKDTIIFVEAQTNWNAYGRYLTPRDPGRRVNVLSYFGRCSHIVCQRYSFRLLEACNDGPMQFSPCARDSITPEVSLSHRPIYTCN